ncbi:MAG TPA: outer membrane protein transport protein [Limnobacter sp.]|uniref:OmpP1/FadL family transporter n=1 Tax=Limnobacter sp. TaxID=2003368 RepID=UPI002E356D95|nr:outer membrane protein transport protein [Limnobacter sp.]HEX5484897.1 outer membrane protein transport protein [Limnobacter sp.]
MKLSILRCIGLGLGFAATCAVGPSAWATNGYFSHGYGTKAKGRGGVALAIPDDAMAGANNPALFLKLDNRLDVGVDAFMPLRGASRTNGPLGGLYNFEERSSSNQFNIPDVGYSRRLNDRMVFGLSIYGNGGLNTDYKQGDSAKSCLSPANPLAGIYAGNPFCGKGPAGVDLAQLVVAPALAYKINDHHAVGFEPLLVYQTFAAEGLQLFRDAGYSSDAAHVTNNDHDSSTGIGYRLGYLGTFGRLSVGAAYSPRINMSKFKKYAGLFADQGDFDIPANYGVGFAWKATPKWLFGVDYNRVNYSDVPSVGNSSRTAQQNCTGSACLGATNGPGFGWSDVHTLKFGAEYAATDKLTLRGGFNVGDNPVSSRDVTFNILAPGVIRKHYTLGATYDWSKKLELSAHYMLAPRETVTGPSALPLPIGSPVESIDMRQQSLSVSVGYKY